MNNISNEILKWNFEKISASEWKKKIEQELSKTPIVQSPSPKYFYTKDDIQDREIPDLVFSKVRYASNWSMPFGVSLNFSSSEKSYDSILQYVKDGIKFICLEFPPQEEKYPEFLAFLRKIKDLSFSIWIDLRNVDENVIFQKINENFLELILDKNITGGILLNKNHHNQPYGLKNKFVRDNQFFLFNLYCSNLSIGEILAIGVACIQNNPEHTPKDILSHLQFTLDIGDDYFHEVSKVRALRFLWHKISKIYLLEEIVPDTFINAIILTNKVKQLQYEDVLTATTRSMSALIGGYDSAIISGVEINGDQSIQKALVNIPNILQEESFIPGILDPGKGSYYIEYQTRQLAEQSWEEFRSIEEKGGYLNYKNGTIE